VFSHAEPARYLTPEIVKNYAERMYSAVDWLKTLEQSEDAGARRRYDQYKSDMDAVLFRMAFLWNWIDSDLKINEEIEGLYNLEKAYQKGLLIHVPPEVKAVYAAHGIGDQGHQGILCLLAGLQIAALQWNVSQDDQPSVKAEKALLRLSSLIHPQDTALIETLIQNRTDKGYE
jgi:hypothetical protein